MIEIVQYPIDIIRRENERVDIQFPTKLDLQNDLAKRSHTGAFSGLPSASRKVGGLGKIIIDLDRISYILKRSLTSSLPVACNIRVKRCLAALPCAFDGIDIGKVEVLIELGILGFKRSQLVTGKVTAPNFAVFHLASILRPRCHLCRKGIRMFREIRKLVHARRIHGDRNLSHGKLICHAPLLIRCRIDVLLFHA